MLVEISETVPVYGLLLYLASTPAPGARGSNGTLNAARPVASSIEKYSPVVVGAMSHLNTAASYVEVGPV